jgi:hypothetical protein
MDATPPAPKPGKANAVVDATVPGVVMFVRTAELSMCPELSLFLPAIAGVSNLSGLVGA